MDITSSPEEIIEEWDWEKGIPTGKGVLRGESYKNGIPHEGVHLWIVRSSSGHPEILFQHRAKHKAQYPDCLDITVGGHVPFGLNENKIQKEAFEELGIDLKDSSLYDLGYLRFEEKTQNYHHREFQHVYITIDNRPLNHYKFNDGEVIGIYAIPIDYLQALFTADSQRDVDGYDGKSLIKRTVSRKDFHPLLFSENMQVYMKIIIEASKELFYYGYAKTKMPGI